MIQAIKSHHLITIVLFYQDLGIARISNNAYTLLTFKNNSIYEEHLHLVISIYDRSTQLCSHSRYTNVSYSKIYRCGTQIHVISEQIEMLNEKFEAICHLTGHQTSEKRSKRGLFNGISSAIKWLFGIP